MRFVDLEPGDERLRGEVFAVLGELRTQLTPQALEQVYAEGHPQGLRFTALYEDDRCVAVAGWRLLATTVSMRKLYVDDLVTAAAERGRGHGAALLGELARRARQEGCRVLDLDSGTQRTDAHRFYLRERMSITSLHFTLPL